MYSGKSLTFRQKLHNTLAHRTKTPDGWVWINAAVIMCIFVSVILVIIETETKVVRENIEFFLVADRIFAILFSIEFLARLWVVGEEEDYKGIKGRLAYILHPQSLLDILAIVPFFFVAGSSDFFLLRLFRLLRILRLTKLSHYSVAFQDLFLTIQRRRYDFMMAIVSGVILMVIASTMLHIAEGKVQPDVFGSIPRAMWWSVVTLTTVGYGDAVPITLVGKLIGSIVAVCSIAFIAIPAGIFAAAFTETMKKRDAVMARYRRRFMSKKPVHKRLPPKV